MSNLFLYFICNLFIFRFLCSSGARNPNFEPRAAIADFFVQQLKPFIFYYFDRHGKLRRKQRLYWRNN